MEIRVLLVWFLVQTQIECFIPAEVLTKVLTKITKKDRIDMGEVSETIVHEVILRRGVILSATQYLIDYPIPGSTVSLAKINNYYQNIRNLYLDYYGVWICEPRLDTILNTILEPNVAIVDFDSKTKNLPLAHFDAELFRESNQRVIDFTNRIYASLATKEYHEARKLTGQILHTIQDFYSHSNWVEMGKTEINTDIGTARFDSLPVAGPSDITTCMANCTLVSVTCSLFLRGLVLVLRILQLTDDIKCPLQYFKCQGNIVELNKLVSGYYSGQSLEDGTRVSKPEPSQKCSHGGILDKDTFLPAAGGINKDGGFYIFSPHADLHLTAASLAINHSAYFYNQIRLNIGDVEFDKFLEIRPSDFQLDLAKLIDRRLCSSGSLKLAPIISVLILVLMFSQCLLDK